MRQVTRNSSRFTHDALSSFQCTRRVCNKFPLRGQSNLTVTDDIGELNRRYLTYRSSWRYVRIKCHWIHLPYKKPNKRAFPSRKDFLTFLKPQPSSYAQSLPYQHSQSLWCDTFEVEVGMKRSHPSQKRSVPPKLKMARSGQGWQRLKTPPILPLAKIRSRDSSRQTFSATELGSPIISTSRSLISMANMAPAY